MSYEQSIDEIVAGLGENKETESKENKKPDDVEVEVEETPQESASERRARSGGWVTKEEWEGDPEDWVDAKQFNLRGELMDRIKEQGKALKNSSKKMDKLEKALRQLGDINTRIAEVQYKKALKDLQRQKAEATSDGDIDKIAELEDSIDELKASDPTPTKKSKRDEDDDEGIDDDTEVPEQRPLPEEFKSWVSRNSWFEEDLDMNFAANRFGALYRERHGNDAPLGEVLKYVDTKIREKFPQMFKKSPTKRTSVEADADAAPSKVKTKSGYTKKDLSEMQVEMGKTFCEGKTAVMSWDEYIDQLVELGDLETQKKKR